MLDHPSQDYFFFFCFVDSFLFLLMCLYGICFCFTLVDILHVGDDSGDRSDMYSEVASPYCASEYLVEPGVVLSEAGFRVGVFFPCSLSSLTLGVPASFLGDEIGVSSEVRMFCSLFGVWWCQECASALLYFQHACRFHLGRLLLLLRMSAVGSLPPVADFVGQSLGLCCCIHNFYVLAYDIFCR